MKLIAKSDYVWMPWKNGQGRTAQISRFPENGDTYLWRLSQAEVSADGPFSVFPGFDRFLSVWQGKGLWLNQDLLAPLQVCAFSGETEIHSRLVAGPILDVGLIYDRARVRAQMKYVDRPSDAALRVTDATNVFFFVTQGQLRFEGQVAVAGDTVEIMKASGGSADRHSKASGFLISIF